MAIIPPTVIRMERRPHVYDGVAVGGEHRLVIHCSRAAGEENAAGMTLRPRQPKAEIRAGKPNTVIVHVAPHRPRQHGHPHQTCDTCAQCCCQDAARPAGSARASRSSLRGSTGPSCSGRAGGPGFRKQRSKPHHDALAAPPLVAKPDHMATPPALIRPQPADAKRRPGDLRGSDLQRHEIEPNGQGDGYDHQVDHRRARCMAEFHCTCSGRPRHHAAARGVAAHSAVRAGHRRGRSRTRSRTPTAWRCACDRWRRASRRARLDIATVLTLMVLSARRFPPPADEALAAGLPFHVPAMSRSSPQPPPGLRSASRCAARHGGPSTLPRSTRPCPRLDQNG